MKNLLSLAISAVISGGVVANETASQHNKSVASNKKAKEIIVTATRIPQTYAETLASVTVFSREDIDRLQAKSLAELLSRAPGMSFTSNGGKGSATGISLRGNQTDHTLFLIDGVRVGSSTLGSTSVQYIDPALIERIEIVRGPKSSLYGSDALGGVVNIISRRGNSSIPVMLKASVGNDNTNDASISMGTKGETYQLNLTASYQYTGGYDNSTSKAIPSDDDDAFRQQSIGFNSSVDVNKDVTLGLSYQLNESESEYDNSCVHNIPSDNESYEPYEPVQCSPYTDSKVEALNVTANWQVLAQWTTSLSVGRSTDETETLADDIDMLTTTSGGEFNTEKTDITWQNNIKLNDAVLLTVGYDYLKEEVSGTTQYDVSERDNKAAFIQAQWIEGVLSVNVGARNDDNEQFGNHDTYNASAGYDVSEDIKVVVSYGEAFKAPTFNDLYFPDFGDPDMVPEESETYELAVKGFGSDYDWSVSAYQNEITNLIQYNSEIFANDQISSATIKGIEANFEKDIAGWLINTSVTLLESQDDATGNELARRPEKVINIDIDRSFDQWSVGATLYAADSRFNDASNASELSGYGTVALRGGYILDDQWKLQLKVDNLFEKDYVISQASSFTGLGDYVPTPGLEVLFSVVYTPEF